MRFLAGGANPSSDEKAPGTHGMSMQIKLPNGSLRTFTGNNFLVFAGKDPKTFLGFLSTLLPETFPCNLKNIQCTQIIIYQKHLHGLKRILYS